MILVEDEDRPRGSLHFPWKGIVFREGAQGVEISPLVEWELVDAGELGALGECQGVDPESNGRAVCVLKYMMEAAAHELDGAVLLITDRDIPIDVPTVVFEDTTKSMEVAEGFLIVFCQDGESLVFGKLPSQTLLPHHQDDDVGKE